MFHICWRVVFESGFYQDFYFNFTVFELLFQPTGMLQPDSESVSQSDRCGKGGNVTQTFKLRATAILPTATTSFSFLPVKVIDPTIFPAFFPEWL